MKSPLDILLPYQRTWADDSARFKIGMWSRQSGKSFATSAESVRDSLVRPGQTWVCMSAGERQALEWMLKARQWAEAFELAVDAYDETRDSAESLMKSAEIKFGNGSRILAIPANPATARGYSANLILDEFAFHEQPAAIWKAIYPSISNPLKGELRLRIVSTPNGQGNKFYDLWTKNSKYSKHKVTIYDAVRLGLPVDPEDLKEALDDEEAWRQEYLCEFIDAAAILLPYEIIALCETDDLSAAQDPEGTVFAGFDVGRKKDLSVYYEINKLGDTQYTRDMVELERMPYHLQFEFLCSRIPKVHRIAIDATGKGEMLAEECARKFGGKVLQCTFTNQLKNELFTRQKRAFEDRTIRIPVNKTLREDLHAVHRIAGKTGLVRYVAPHTEDGHSDRSTALALALHAATDAGGPQFVPQAIRADRQTQVNRRVREIEG
jgi:phage FluMu gp28-like protein